MTSHPHKDFTDTSTLLSPEGRARREQILAVGLAAAAQRARRRSAVQLSSTIGVLVLCIGAAWIGMHTRSGALGAHAHRHRLAHGDGTPAHRTPAPAPAPEPTSAAMTTDGIERIDDRQLLALLAQTGDSYGLVRVEGRVDLVRNDPAR